MEGIQRKFRLNQVNKLLRILGGIKILRNRVNYCVNTGKRYDN